MKGRTLKPGDVAHVSGIYLIRHNMHRLPERELILEGSRVPECDVCRDAVTYELQAPCLGRTPSVLAMAAA
jgi:hypothetical protein